MARSRQEIFDTAYKGLASQGFVRSRDGHGCLYRGPSRLRCAIGHCIPDDVWEEQNLERFNSEQMGGPIQEAAQISDDDVNFATELQSAHDNGMSPVSMQCALEAFAKRHGLTIPEVAS